MNLAMASEHAETAIVGLGLAVLCAATFLSALWGLCALVGLSTGRTAGQLSPVRVRYPAQVRTRPRDRGGI